MNLRILKHKKYRLILILSLILLSAGTTFAFYYTSQQEQAEDFIKLNTSTIAQNGNEKKIPLGKEYIPPVTYDTDSSSNNIKGSEINFDTDILQDKTRIINREIEKNKDTEIVQSERLMPEVNTNNNRGGAIALTPIPESEIDPGTGIPIYDYDKYLLDVLANLDPNNDYRFTGDPYNNRTTYPNTNLITSVEGFNQEAFTFVWLKIFSKYLMNISEEGYPFSTINNLGLYRENDVPLYMLGTQGAPEILRDIGQIKDFEKKIDLSEFDFSEMEIYHMKILALLYPELDPQFVESYCNDYEHPNCPIDDEAYIYRLYSTLGNKFTILLSDIYDRGLELIGVIFMDTVNGNEIAANLSNIKFSGSNSIPINMGNISGLSSSVINKIAPGLASQISAYQVITHCHEERIDTGFPKPYFKLYRGAPTCYVCKQWLCYGRDLLTNVPIVPYTYIWGLDYGGRCGCSDGYLLGF